jgi:hypothetical protein
MAKIQTTKEISLGLCVSQNIAGIVDYERIYENLSYDDKDNPHSLVNIAPTPIVEIMNAIPNEMFELDETQLTTLFKVEIIDDRLRTSFWSEYVRAVRTEQKMNMHNIYGGICSKSHFVKYILGNTKRTMYMLTPRPDFHAECEDILFILTRKMRQIAEGLDVYSKDGSVNLKAVEKISKAWETLTSKRRTFPTKKMLVGHIVKSDHPQLTPAKEMEIIEQTLQLESTPSNLPNYVPETEAIEYAEIKEEEKTE